jgi:hypothetical protein
VSFQSAERATLAELATALDQLQGVAPPVVELLAPDYWDEDTVAPFQNSRYKILSRLGSGGIGQTFKVVELDAHSDERFGAYVAKTVRHWEDGEAALRAYCQVRAQTTHPNLSTIHEIAPEWRANGFMALLKWIEGMPLQDWIGVLPLYAEELGEPSGSVGVALVAGTLRGSRRIASTRAGAWRCQSAQYHCSGRNGGADRL